MSEWWQALEQRQRALIGVAAAVLIGAVVYVWVWEPLAQARQQQRERVAEQQALLSWLDAVAPLAQSLRGREQPERDLGERSLLGLTDETARAAGLAGAVARIEPSGDGQVRVWLEGADFVTVMGWLESYSRSRPIRIEQLQIDRAQSEGQVNARVTLISDA